MSLSVADELPSAFLFPSLGYLVPASLCVSLCLVVAKSFERARPVEVRDAKRWPEVLAMPAEGQRIRYTRDRSYWWLV